MNEKIFKEYSSLIEKVNEYFMDNINDGYYKREELVKESEIFKKKNKILDDNIKSLNFNYYVDKNKSYSKLIENCVNILKIIKIYSNTDDMNIRNIIKEFFFFLYENVFPKNFIRSKKFSETHKAIYNNDKLSSFKKQQIFTDISIEFSLLIKIQNFQIFQFINILLISTNFMMCKDFEESLVFLSKTEDFIFNKHISFDFTCINTPNSVIYECDNVLQFIRYKLLNNYLISLEKTKNVKTKITEIFKLYRKSAIENEHRITVTLINFIIRQYILNKSYSQAQNFINKISLFTDDQISLKQGIRFYYYCSFILIVQGDIHNAFNYSEKALRSITNIVIDYNKENKGRLPKLFLNILVIFLILQVKLINANFVSENSVIKCIQNVFHEYYSNKNALLNLNIILLVRKCILLNTKEILPYLHLISSVINGKIKSLDNFLFKYQEKYFKDGLYLVLSRLNRNAIIYGLIKLNRKYANQTIPINSILEDLDLGNDKFSKDCYNKEKFVYIIAKNIKEEVINAKIIKRKGTEIDEYRDDFLIEFKLHSIDSQDYLNEISFKNHLYLSKFFSKNTQSSNNSSIIVSTDNSIDNSN